MGRRRGRLPREILSPPEIARLLDAPDPTRLFGFSDRAIIELIYCTGIRRAECSGLDRDDLCVQTKSIWVRSGKGNRDRVLPVSNESISRTSAYINALDSGYAPTGPWMFAGLRRRRLGPKGISALVTRFARAVNPRVMGSAHMLRHSMATHLLDGGADIRHIQAILGHSDLNSTAIYTQVSTATLRRAWAAAHPRADVECASPEVPPDKELGIGSRRFGQSVFDDG